MSVLTSIAILFTEEFKSTALDLGESIIELLSWIEKNSRTKSIGLLKEMVRLLPLTLVNKNISHEHRQRGLRIAMNFLGHRYPTVRAATSNLLYLLFLQTGAEGINRLFQLNSVVSTEKTLELLVDTDWLESSTTECKEIRDIVAQAFALERLSKSTKLSKNSLLIVENEKRDVDGYASLVMNFARGL